MKQLQSILEIKTESISNIKDNILRGLSGEVKENEESVTVEDIEIDLSEDSNDADNNINNSQDSIMSSQKSQGYKNTPDPVKLTGFISSCAHGSGRSSTDRQFFYVNSRPCEPTKVIKLINETYRQYNPNQYPFVFLDVNVDRISVDVNVTPDKRKLFLTKEKAVLDVIKNSLLKLFENIPRTLKVETSNNNASQKVEAELSQPRIFQSFVKQFSNQSETSLKSNNENPEKSELKRKSTSVLDNFIATKRSYASKVDKTISEHKVVVADSDSESESFHNKCDKNSDIEIIADDDDIIPKKLTVDETRTQQDIMYLEDSNALPNTQIRNISDVVFVKSHTIRCKPKDVLKSAKPKLQVVTDKEELGQNNRKIVNLKTSLEHVKALVDIYSKKNKKSQPDRIKFRSAINPVFNKKCEEELTKEISKDSFKRMAVIGQFNLGFIITRLDEDLFIIDQHATDEIYNFETLQKTTELTSQKLVM